MSQKSLAQGSVQNEEKGDDDDDEDKDEERELFSGLLGNGDENILEIRER